VGTTGERRFVDWFMRAVGILAGFIATMVLLASYAVRSAHTAPKDPMDPRAIESRIAPIERVVVSGRDSAAAAVPETAAPAASGAATPAAATGSAAVMSGEQVYASTCIACHGAGVAGAPKFGDKAAWSARIGQGAAVLHQHALEGFQGKAGVMPPKGGRVDLADQSILNAVDYMVSAAK
jgi:cytochrome c5